jgi:hypothetical protein
MGRARKETDRASLFERMGASLKTIVAGLLCVAAAVAVLWLNEGRGVKQDRTFREGRSVVVTIDPQDRDPATDGKLVHLTGEARTEDVLSDDAFGVSAQGLKLRREVLMFQWQETLAQQREEQTGGGKTKVKTPTYSRIWSSTLIDSSRFSVPAGHGNPESMAFESREQAARRVIVGAYALSPELVAQIDAFEPLRLTDEALQDLPPELRREASVHEGCIYLGKSPAEPQVGDLRVGFSRVPPVTVSLVARRVGGTFEPYASGKTGAQIPQMLRMGTHSAKAMFAGGGSNGSSLLWVLRFAGFGLMLVGLATVLRPLSRGGAARVFGRSRKLGFGLVSVVSAFALSLATIGLAWVAHRPLAGISLLALAVIAVAAVLRLRIRPARPESEHPGTPSQPAGPTPAQDDRSPPSSPSS